MHNPTKHFLCYRKHSSERATPTDPRKTNKKGAARTTDCPQQWMKRLCEATHSLGQLRLKVHAQKQEKCQSKQQNKKKLGVHA